MGVWGFQAIKVLKLYTKMYNVHYKAIRYTKSWWHPSSSTINILICIIGIIKSIQKEQLSSRANNIQVHSDIISFLNTTVSVPRIKIYFFKNIFSGIFWFLKLSQTFCKVIASPLLWGQVTLHCACKKNQNWAAWAEKAQIRVCLYYYIHAAHKFRVYPCRQHTCVCMRISLICTDVYTHTHTYIYICTSHIYICKCVSIRKILDINRTAQNTVYSQLIQF